MHNKNIRQLFDSAQVHDVQLIYHLVDSIIFALLIKLRIAHKTSHFRRRKLIMRR